MNQDKENDKIIRDPKSRPSYLLSVNLIDTFKNINKIYYEKKSRQLKPENPVFNQANGEYQSRGGVFNSGFDDENYDYILKPEEILANRYCVKHKMGRGSFGQVVCAYDLVNKVEVAVKIIKSKKPFMVQASTEIEILTHINTIQKEKDLNYPIVKLLDQFVHINHQCLVFEMLSYNLYELLRNTKFKGISLNLIKKLSVQLLYALDFLSHPSVNIIHCDLKPENILLRHPKKSALKLIDFGSSCYQNKKTFTYIQSRFYRSPEVLLGLPYTAAIDIWSLGCVLVEMHTGEPLFGGCNQLDQLRRIIEVLGMPPLSMIKQSPPNVCSHYFDTYNLSDLNQYKHHGNYIIDEENSIFYQLKKSSTTTLSQRSPPLEKLFLSQEGGPYGRRLNEPGHSIQCYKVFLSFISSMLVYLPEKRAKPSELLLHPYLDQRLTRTDNKSLSKQIEQFNLLDFNGKCDHIIRSINEIISLKNEYYQNLSSNIDYYNSSDSNNLNPLERISLCKKQLVNYYIIIKELVPDVSINLEKEQENILQEAISEYEKENENKFVNNSLSIPNLTNLSLEPSTPSTSTSSSINSSINQSISHSNPNSSSSSYPLASTISSNISTSSNTIPITSNSSSYTSSNFDSFMPNPKRPPSTNHSIVDEKSSLSIKKNPGSGAPSSPM